ncbi:MAG: ABC transporter ATP-binding protein/permease [Lachnospiraceae bacterium]|nr:ABC transporter ATP-binding protein/permease [Lachnospiraceae bacterium]
MPGPGDRGGVKQKPKDAKKTFRRLLKYMMEYGGIFFILILFAFASNIGNLLGPGFAGKAINEASAGAGAVDMRAVIRYGLLMLGAYVGSNILSFLVNIGMMRVGRSVARNLRRDVFNKLMELPVGYFDKHMAGDIISRVSYDIDVVCVSLSSDIVQILTSLVTVAGSFIMMCVISPPLVMCMIFTIPVSVLFTRYMGKRTRPLYRERSRAYGEMNGFAEEMFTGQKTILAYAQEDRVCEDFSKINKAAATAYKNADGLGLTMGPTIGMISNFGLSAIGLGGAILYMYGIVGLGQISSFILYSRKFSGPINEISNIINEIFSALAAAERVFQLLDEQEESKDAEYALTLENADGSVEAEDIEFGYIPGKTILHDFNMEARPGETVAIVGHTGAGKTTMVNLLMRFYDPQKGKISVDGRDICGYTMESLRKSYSMVLQDTWVFNGSIFDNIAYGKENATREEVTEAAKAAHIHNYIMKLPGGYNTVISEDGGNISKGQKQLITIARAMLYDTGMLILDEATSNVDTATERRVQAAMKKLMKGKTCFIIAHRLSTIRNADNILVMEQGDVIEQGKHEELMERKGAYYKLYRSQFE